MPARRPIRAAVSRAALAGALAAAMVATGSPAAFGEPPQVQARLADGTLTVTGTGAADRIGLRLGPAGSEALEVLTGLSRNADFRFRRSEISRIRVDAAAGADVVSVIETNGAFPDTIETTILGGDDNDQLTGGAGAEVIVAGAGADSVQARGGADTLLLGSDGDTVTWSIGDGRDVIEGQTGSDIVRLTGSTEADHVELSANGSRLRIFWPVGQELLDLASLEKVSVRPAAGGDTVVVNDLTGSGTKAVVVDLHGSPTSPSDGEADDVQVAGTPGADEVSLAGSGGQSQVTGLAAAVEVLGSDRFLDLLTIDADAGIDEITAQPSVGSSLAARVNGGEDPDVVMANLTSGADSATVSVAGSRARVSFGGSSFDANAEITAVNGLGGTDNLRTVGNLDAVTKVVLDGGNDADILTGDESAEILVGGSGVDQAVGHGGVDVLQLGDGNDHAFWTAGDGDDIVEGGSGQDFLTFRGGEVSERVSASSLGARVQLQWASERVDVNDVETANLTPLRGEDTVTVGDLSGTDLLEVIAELESAVGSGTGDGQSDRVVVQGTNGVDSIVVTGIPNFVTVDGLSALTRVRHAEFTLDGLTVDTQLGADQVSTTGLAPGSIQVSVS